MNNNISITKTINNANNELIKNEPTVLHLNLKVRNEKDKEAILKKKEMIAEKVFKISKLLSSEELEALKNTPELDKRHTEKLPVRNIISLNLKVQPQEQIKATDDNKGKEEIDETNMQVEPVDDYIESIYEQENEEANLSIIQCQEEELNQEANVVKLKEDEGNTLSLLSKILEFSKSVVKNNTFRVVNTLVVGSVAIDIAYGGGIIAKILGAGLAISSVSELKNVFYKEVNSLGKNSFLQAIEIALTNIDKRNTSALESIQRATKYNEQIFGDLNGIEIKIEELRKKIKESNSELKFVITEAITSLKITKSELINQYNLVNEALDNLVKAQLIMFRQSSALENLKNVEYAPQTEQDLVQIIEEIQTEIGRIKEMSDKACEAQVKASDQLLQALDLTNSVLGLENKSIDLLLKITMLQKNFDQLEDELDQTKQKVQQTEHRQASLQGELNKIEKLNREQKTDIKIAQDQLAQEEQIDKYGEDSITYGTGLTTGAGLVLGSALGLGPWGAGAGALFTSTFLSKFAIKGVHMARKLLRANKALEKKHQDNLIRDKMSKPNELILEIKVEAKFGHSKGKIFGTQGVKTLYNLGAWGLSSLLKSEYPEWTSNRAGTVKLMFDGTSITFEFDKNNPEIEKYGAIPLTEQQRICNSLKIAVENGNIDPKKVLDLFKSLEKIHVGLQVITMIRPESDGIKNLKILCQDKVNQNQNEKVKDNEEEQK